MKKSKKSLFSAVITAILILACIMGSAMADGEISGKSAEEICDMLGLGWNLGNTLDATGGSREDVMSHETSWGNPVVTKELIHAVKEEGFTTIRIPTTWFNYADENYNIDQVYIDRVKEIVGWAIDEGLFVILNVHHEDWVNIPDLATDYETVGHKLTTVWSQIAENFAEFDQHLIFEGMNEPRAAGTDIEWTGNTECYEAVNYLTQVFVNTVRASDKGYNQERVLMIPGYAAGSSTSIMGAISLPTVNGEVCNNLMVEIHCYSPYNFCLQDSQKTFDPNKSEDTAGIDILFNEIDSLFLSQGIPAVIDETSATAKNNVEAREKWAAYMGKKSAEYGVPVVIWDNGNDSNSGGESHAHMDRTANKANYPTVFKALFDAYAAADYKSARSTEQTSKLADGANGTVIWSNESGLESKKQWDASYIQMGAQSTYFLEGRDIVLEYTGNGEPKIILDSEVKQEWWIPVDPSEIKEENGKKKAVFTNASIMTELAKFNITNPADLRNLCVIAANDNIKTYSITVEGGKNVATYYANGRFLGSSSELPDDPQFKNMTFLGWYSTKDYKAGTEYTGGELTSDLTLYAKFAITEDALTKYVAETPVEEVTPTATPTEAAEVTEKPDDKEAAVSETPKEEAGDKAGDKAAKDSKKSSDDSSEKSSGTLSTVLIVLGAICLVIAVVCIIKSKSGNSKQ